MLKLRLPSLLALGALALGLFSTAYADITPLRTGPVSQYGQLMAGKNAQNEGRIYGSCEAYSTSGNEVQVKGMSLFWSNETGNNRYWKRDVITGMVQKQGIQLIRAAMAVDDQGWGNGHYFLNGKTEYYQALLDEAVSAAIENDIYVIIDYHTHTANNNWNRAKEFFKIQAKKWGMYDNVIFEIYNEPICVHGFGDKSGSSCKEYGGWLDMDGIKAYADDVIPVIRRYSDNLIVVGTPKWSGEPGAAVDYPVDDPLNNVAYTLHYYGGYTSDGNTHMFYPNSSNRAMENGLAVFVTEWGAIGYDGGGTITDPFGDSGDQNNLNWLNWMDEKKLSSANWNNGLNGTEGGQTAAEYFTVNFTGIDDATTVDWTYSASGQWVNEHVFAGLSTKTYSQCGSYVDLPALLENNESDGEFGDVYEDEVIPNDYVVEDFDENRITQWTYAYIGGEWTNDNNGEKTFWDSERKSTVGGLVNLVTTEGDGYAGYGMHVSNLKGCQTLSYKYKGLKHDLDFANTDGADLAVKTYVESSDWTTVEFDMSGIDASVVDLGSALDIKWVLQGPANGESFYVDDVVCGDPYGSNNSSSSSSGGNLEFVDWIIDFEGNGRATWDYDKDAYDFIAANEDWTIGNEIGRPEWCRYSPTISPCDNPDYKEYVEKTVYDYELASNVGALLDIHSGVVENGDAVIGVHMSSLENCEVVQYRYKGQSHKLQIFNYDNETATNYSESEALGEEGKWTTAMYDLSGAIANGLDVSQPINVQWSVLGPVDGGSFYIDDVGCYLRGSNGGQTIAGLIDNFEDENIGVDYAWPYLFTFASATGSATVKNDEDEYGTVVRMSKAAAEGEYGIGLEGVTTTGTGDAGAVLVKKVPGISSECTVISYQYKGAAHAFKAVDPALDVESNTYDVHRMLFSSSDSWKMVWVDVSELKQWGHDDVLDVSKVTELRWEVNNSSGNLTNVDLYVDNVRCASEDEAREYVVENFDGDETVPTFAYVWDPYGTTISNPENDYGSYDAIFEGAGYEGSKASGIENLSGPSGATVAIMVSGLKGCEAVQYKYRGGAHDLWAVVNDEERGPHSVANASSDWTTETLLVSELKVNLAEVEQLRWGLPYDEDYNYLYVDDVACVAAPASSSSSEESSSSASYEAYVVADFDGNGTLLYGYAYAYGYSTIENSIDPDCDNGNGCPIIDMGPVAQNGTTAAGIVGIMGLSESDDPADGAAVFGLAVPNLNGCKTLKYDYKGAGHNLKVRNNESDGEVAEMGNFASTTEWKTQMVSVQGLDLGSVSDIRFEVVGKPYPDYLYIDDVECVLQDPPIELPEPNAPTTNTELVDDFEDGNLDPLWDVGPYWVETDVIGGGGASTAALSFVKGNNSSKALQMAYSLDVGGYPWGPPYVTISTNDFANMNLSQCTEVRYDYKGAAHKFRLKVSETMNNLLDMGWGFPTFTVSDPSESWQTVTIPVASLRQEWTGESGNWVDVETILPYVNGFDWRIDGEDVYDKSSGTLAIDNVRCIGLAETQYYTITFKNGDEDYEVKDWAAGSNVPDPAGTPSKTPDAQFTYEFDHWTWGSDPDRTVTGKASYEAVYNSVLRSYTVTFLMDDGETIHEQVGGVEYGTPVLDVLPPDPAKDADAQFTYTFGGWDPAITGETVVTGDVSYTANFTTVTNMYSVAFVDDDDTPLKGAVEYPYGTPVDQIDVPVVADKGGLKFAGWEPGLATVTGDVTYKAVYTDKIVITWKDDDGSVLRLDYVDDGDMPYYGEDPAKDPTAEFTYTFDKWTPAVVAATEDATYTASFTSVKNKYDVTFVAEHNPDANVTVSKEYGEAVASFAPQVGDVMTAEYAYAFDGWTPSITDQTIVTGEATYTAKYTQSRNRYTVEFVMDDGVTPAATSVTRDYGTEIASLLPSDPTKAPTVAKTYEFDRWVVKVSDTQDQELEAGATLRAGMTLKAVFKEFDRKYLITFVDYDDSPLGGGGTLYVYGTAAADITPADPTRDPDDEFSYTFAGWTPTVTAVTGEQVYKATYTQTALGVTTYTITFTGDADVTGIPSSMTVEEGTLVSTLLPSTNPSKAQTDEFTYTFSKWVVVDGTDETDLAAGATVTGDLTLKAVFTATTRTYTVSFVKESGVTGLPEDKTVEYGVAVSTLLPAIAPEKEMSIANTFSFSKWVVVNGTDETDLATDATVKGNLTLKAVFTENDREYTVTFVGEEGVTGLPDAATVEYGVKVSTLLPTTNPTKGQTAQYTYSFSKWMIVDGNTMYDWTANTTVEGDMTLMAQFTSTARVYTITFVHGDKSETNVELAYDEMPVAPEVKLPANTAQYTYSFDKWEPAIAKVTGNKTYTAKVNTVLNEYKITFLNYDNTELQSSDVEYGKTPEYKGATPTRDPSATHTYSFIGWTPDVVAVTGAASYTAKFREEEIPVESSSSETVVSSSSEGTESSSSETVVSSSSETAPSSSSVAPSSSSVKPSSSSVKPESSAGEDDQSSSSRGRNRSSSSVDEDVSSSSGAEDDVKSSSSGKTDALFPTVAGLNMVFSHNELTVTVSKASEVKVQVFDMQGNLQERYQGYSAGDHVVSLRHLTKGIYIVRVTSGSSVKTQRISIR